MRQNNALVRAKEGYDSHFFFQFVNGVTETGLSDKELISGFSEISALRHFDKILQLLQFQSMLLSWALRYAKKKRAIPRGIALSP